MVVKSKYIKSKFETGKLDSTNFDTSLILLIHRYNYYIVNVLEDLMENLFK